MFQISETVEGGQFCDVMCTNKYNLIKDGRLRDKNMQQ